MSEVKHVLAKCAQTLDRCQTLVAFLGEYVLSLGVIDMDDVGLASH